MASRRTERRRVGRERERLRQDNPPATYEEDFRDYHGPASRVVSSIDGELQSERRIPSRPLTPNVYLEQRDFNVNDELRGLHGLASDSAFEFPPAETRLPSMAASDGVPDTGTNSADRLDHPNSPAVDAVTIKREISPDFHERSTQPIHIDELNKAIERGIINFVTHNLDSLIEKFQSQKRKQSTEEETVGIHLTKRHKPSEHPMEVAPATAKAIPRMLQPISHLGLPHAVGHDPRSHGTVGSPLLGSDLDVWLGAIQNDKVREGQSPPLSFSIKLLHNDVHLDVGVMIKTAAFRTIYKWLKAALLLGRDLDKLKDSHKKGNWKCLYTMASIESMSWPREGRDGQYACKTCLARRQPCILVTAGQMTILPLPPSLRMNIGIKSPAFCLLPDGLTAPPASFYR